MKGTRVNFMSAIHPLASAISSLHVNKLWVILMGDRWAIKTTIMGNWLVMKQ